MPLLTHLLGNHSSDEVLQPYMDGYYQALLVIQDKLQVFMNGGYPKLMDWQNTTLTPVEFTESVTHKHVLCKMYSYSFSSSNDVYIENQAIIGLDRGLLLIEYRAKHLWKPVVFVFNWTTRKYIDH